MEFSCLIHRACFLSWGTTSLNGPSLAGSGFPSTSYASKMTLSENSGSISGREKITSYPSLALTRTYLARFSPRKSLPNVTPAESSIVHSITPLKVCSLPSRSLALTSELFNAANSFTESFRGLITSPPTVKYALLS